MFQYKTKYLRINLNYVKMKWIW